MFEDRMTLIYKVTKFYMKSLYGSDKSTYIYFNQLLHRIWLRDTQESNVVKPTSLL